MTFIRAHGWGFVLHMLGAVAIMAAGWWLAHLLVALIVNTVLWPVRELIQKILKSNVAGFFTFHVWLEWVPAVAVGFIIYGVN